MIKTVGDLIDELSKYDRNLVVLRADTSKVCESIYLVGRTTVTNQFSEVMEVIMIG